MVCLTFYLQKMYLFPVETRIFFAFSFSSFMRYAKINTIIWGMELPDYYRQGPDQICDFVSYFAHLYYKTHNKKETLPNRVAQLIDSDFVGRVMATFHVNGILNLKASSNKHGFVIYPK